MGPVLALRSQPVPPGPSDPRPQAATLASRETRSWAPSVPKPGPLCGDAWVPSIRSRGRLQSGWAGQQPVRAGFFGDTGALGSGVPLAFWSNCRARSDRVARAPSASAFGFQLRAGAGFTSACGFLGTAAPQPVAVGRRGEPAFPTAMGDSLSFRVGLEAAWKLLAAYRSDQKRD